jgi:hypothetical protein
MEKEIRAQRLATKVTAVERGIDDTLALAAELMIEGRAASTEWNLAAQATDSAFAKLIEAMGQLQAARTSVVATHKRMEKVRDAIGIRPTGLQPVKEIEADTGTAAMSEVVRLHG